MQVPYADDPALNFAYFVYDGIPEYQTNQGIFGNDVLESLPVYQFITRQEDMRQVLAYSSADQIAQGPDARFTYNWPGTMVYNGEVYDNIKYRLRGANGRYHAAGKRSMRFRFNKGNYFQALDQDGEPYPTKWRTLTTGKGFDNRQTLTWGLNEALSLHLYNQIGLPASDTHWVHFRVIDEAAESPDQWRGDFWGLNFIVETYDVRFLEAHQLEKGNLYKLINSRRDAASQQRYQAPDAVSDGSDHDNIEANLTGNSTAEWLDAYVRLEKYYLHHALGEAIRHYDFWPDANKNMVYYFEPEYTQENNGLGKLWLLPWDTDASWGPTWNSGHDVVYNGIFPASGGGSDGNSTPELWPAYFNVVREIRDLLWQPDQIEPLIDEFASIIDAFEKADRARWQNAPADAGNYNGIGGAGITSLAALVQDMKNFAFVGGNWPGGGVGAGGRAAYLDTYQGSRGEADEIPFTPSISYTGDVDFAANGLAFRTSTFADPQGADTFAAMEWRVAKITDPTAPAYDPKAKFMLEWNAAWESGELTTFNDTIHVPAGVIDVGHTYRARVRMQDATGRWSHWSEPIEFTTTTPDNTQLLKDHLRITEVHFNPLGPTAAEIIAGFDNNDDYEFIEVINTSAVETLDLAGAKFVDGIEFEFASSDVTSLAPGERVVIVENSDAFRLRYGAGIPVAGEWSGALANGGEMLVLAAPDDSPILEFTFAANDDWPARADGDGSSLQIVDTGGDYTAATNWRASTTIHGTPGAAAADRLGGVVINEILTHTDPPLVDAIELYNPTAEAVDISGWFLSDSNADVEALAKFQIPAGTVLGPEDYIVFDENNFNASGGENPHDFAFSSSGDEAWLTAGTEFRPLFFVDNISFGGTPPGETLGRVPNGNGLLAPQHRATLGCTNSVPRVGPLVISELMYAPAEPTAAELVIEPALDAEDFEFVEIFNPTAATVDLSGWELAGGVDFVFPAGVALNADSALVVLRFNPGIPANAGKAQAFESRYGVVLSGNGFLGGYGGRLSEVGERVELRRFTADPVEDFHVLDDGVIYDTESPWPADVEFNDQSIQRVAPVYWGSAPTSWAAAAASPGTVSFSIVVAGDVTGDGQVTADDVDVLYAVAKAGSTVRFYDVDDSGNVDQTDALYVVQNILNTQRGDANLDGVVDGSDFNTWNDNKFETCGKSWRHGEFTGDGFVDGSDFNLWFGNRFTGTPQASPAAERAPRAALPDRYGSTHHVLPASPRVIDAWLAGTNAASSRMDVDEVEMDIHRPNTQLIDARWSAWHTRSSARIRSFAGEDAAKTPFDVFADLDTVDEALRSWRS